MFCIIIPWSTVWLWVDKESTQSTIYSFLSDERIYQRPVFLVSSPPARRGCWRGGMVNALSHPRNKDLARLQRSFYISWTEIFDYHKLLSANGYNLVIDPRHHAKKQVKKLNIISGIFLVPLCFCALVGDPIASPVCCSVPQSGGRDWSNFIQAMLTHSAALDSLG